MSKQSRVAMIPLCEPRISGNEWKYVKDCLDTGWVSYLGEYVSRFEQEVARYAGARFGIAVVNGTAALHTSLLVSGIRPDDEVLVPTLTFIAPVNAVRYCNCHPVFMDADPESLCLDVGKVVDFVTSHCEMGKDGYSYNRTTKRRVRAVVPVHIFGHPTDMDPLIEISKKYRIDVIEDATESLGSFYKGRRTGSFGLAGCFSFNGNKIITTGGGGMIVTDEEGFAVKAKHLTTQAKRDPIEYDHDEIGFNYRLSNVLAAIGVAQMEKIDEVIKIKRRNSDLYNELLKDITDVKFLGDKAWAESNRWFYTLRVSKEHKESLAEHLLSKGVQVRPIWKLIHTLPMYRQDQTYMIENAPGSYETCINLPCSAGLTEEDVAYVCDSLRGYFRG